MNSELTDILQECDTLKARLSEMRPLPVEALKKIEEAYNIEYTYESNRIEGNTLTLQETELVVNEGVTIAGKSMREHLEAINHAEAIDYIRDFAKQDTEISERTIKEIHALILHGIDRENAGRYRTVPVLMNLHLLRNGYTLVNLKGSDEARRMYYDALEKSHSDPVPFQKLVAEAEISSLRSYLSVLGCGAG